jgi:hypothetical protein
VVESVGCPALSGYPGDEYRECEIGIKCFFKFFGGNLLERSA